MLSPKAAQYDVDGGPPATRIWSLYLAVFLDATGVYLIHPLLPFIVLKLGGTAFDVGLLTSVYALMQAVGLIVLGKISDRVGRRLVLLFCFLGSSITLLVLSQATTIIEFTILRAIGGFFNSTMGVSQAFIAELVKPEDRAGCNSLIAAAVGLGLVIGPGIGGTLDTAGYAKVALFGACTTGFNFSTAFFALPRDQRDTQTLEEDVDAPADPSPEPPAPWHNQLGSLLRNPATRIVYMLTVLQALNSGNFYGIAPVYLKDMFNYDGKKLGHLYCAAGASMLLCMLLCTKPAVCHLGERHCLAFGHSVRAVAYCLLVSSTLHCIPWISTILALGSGAFLSPVASSLISATVPGSERGFAIGMNEAISSFGNCIGPLIGGAVYLHQKSLPFLLATSSAVLSALLAEAFIVTAPSQEGIAKAQEATTPLLSNHEETIDSGAAIKPQ